MERAASVLLFVTCLLASTSSASAVLLDSLCLLGLPDADRDDAAVSASEEAVIVEPLGALLPPPPAASHRWPEETVPGFACRAPTASIRAPPPAPLSSIA